MSASPDRHATVNRVCNLSFIIYVLDLLYIHSPGTIKHNVEQKDEPRIKMIGLMCDEKSKLSYSI